MQKLMDMVTAKLVTEGVVKACDKEWFAYGLEKRILTIFTAIPFLIIAIALSDIWTAVMYVTLYNHTDVVVRAKASTSAQKVHTLYVGDTVYIYKWIYGTADDYDWASIRHYDSELQRNIFGYSANYFLS